MFEVANLDRVSWAQIGSRLFEVADFDRADRAQIDPCLFEVSSSVPGGYFCSREQDNHTADTD